MDGIFYRICLLQPIDGQNKPPNSVHHICSCHVCRHVCIWNYLDISDKRGLPVAGGQPDRIPASGHDGLWCRGGVHTIHHGGGGLHTATQNTGGLCCSEYQV